MHFLSHLSIFIDRNHCEPIFQVPAKLSWETGVESLKDALKTEAKVTKSIRQVIEKCENDNSNNDYHVRFHLNSTPFGF